MAGGRSSRFGSDKARITIQGEPLLLRLARTLQPFATSLTIVADVQDKYRDLGLRTIVDRVGGLGPIGGLITTLHDRAEEGWLLVTACDWIDVRPVWIKLLLSGAGSDVEAVAFKGALWESLLTLFRPSIRPRVEKNIALGQLSIRQLLEESSTRALPLPHDWESRWHINTPQDLARYLRMERRRDC
ncbi:MAG TPA: molybdenum cofactor guanylyltransferase [Acidobacteriota bacterium]